MIKEINTNTLIIRYKSEEDKKDISKKNTEGVSIIVKNALLNFGDTIPNYL